MERLWTPWRSTYLENKSKTQECIFCKAAGSDDDQQALVIHRAAQCFVLLNRYPYTSGHLMIAPYRHVARLNEMEEEAASEMMLLQRHAERAIELAYRPDGLNMGINLGAAAGAGIAEHLHLHALPRWYGDANFMTAVGETRIFPETLADTYQKLKAHFGD